MAAGTSVICTRVDSLRNIIRDGHCGYLVDYGDTTALGQKMVSLLRDERKQKEFRQKGRAAVERHYNWDIQIKKLSKELFGTRS